MLRHAASGRVLRLKAHTTVGRHPSNDIALDGDLVSSQHAVIQWTGKSWTVRDLASRNGTFVDDQRLTPGVSKALGEMSTVAFGDAGQRWWLIDADAPRPFAESLVDGARVDAIGDVLGLPSNDAPLVMVFPGFPLWVVEDAEGTRPFEDGTVLIVEGVPWRVTVPQVPDPTGALPVAQPGVRLRVSGHIGMPKVEVQTGGRWKGLRRQAAHKLLWVLTREHAEDTGRDPADRGLTHIDVVADELDVTADNVNVYVHRLRDRLGRHGVHDLIERRAGVGQLRLSYPTVEWAPRR